jgi:hypothetical protein
MRPSLALFQTAQAHAERVKKKAAKNKRIHMRDQDKSKLTSL